ncbi:MAG: SWIM zinc finger family protein [Caldilineaceae bacterium]
MINKLTAIDAAYIQTRCNASSYSRGQSYYAGGAVQQRLRHKDGIEAHVAGSTNYRVIVRTRAGGLDAFCTCPYDHGGDCKHIVATLLAWLHEPQSFGAANELQLALAARKHAELVQLLLQISTAYPHLVDEFALLGDLTTFDPTAAVDEIFDALGPHGDFELSMDEAVTRMEHVARQAARLAQQGQGERARQTYYALTHRCVDFCESYGAHDIFPPNIPYDFAEAYRDLAYDQLDDHAAAIEAEVDTILGGKWAPELLGITDVLCELLDVEPE